MWSIPRKVVDPSIAIPNDERRGGLRSTAGILHELFMELRILFCPSIHGY